MLDYYSFIDNSLSTSKYILSLPPLMPVHTVGFQIFLYDFAASILFYKMFYMTIYQNSTLQVFPLPKLQLFRFPLILDMKVSKLKYFRKVSFVMLKFIKTHIVSSDSSNFSKISYVVSTTKTKTLTMNV